MSETNKRHIVFYLQGSVDIGLGHLMRCDCLAGALVDQDFVCTVVTPSAPSFIAEYIHHFSQIVTLDNPSQLAQTVSSLPAPIALVIDDYQLTAPQITALKADLKLPIVVIDDLQRDFDDIDLLVDFADSDRQKTFKTCSGPSYTFIRDEFLHAAHGSEYDLLINFGGTDPDIFTLHALYQLNTLSQPLKLCIVVGKYFPAHNELESAIAASPHTITHIVAATNMAELMASSRMLLLAPGTTVFEGAVVGKPMILLITDPCQRNNYQLFIDQQAALGATLSTLTSRVSAALEDKKLAVLVENARALCDGYGKFKIANEISALIE